MSRFRNFSRQAAADLVVRADRVAAAAQAIAPGWLFGLWLGPGDYNQDLTPAALLVEIGNADSGFAEVAAGAELLARASIGNCSFDDGPWTTPVFVMPYGPAGDRIFPSVWTRCRVEPKGSANNSQRSVPSVTGCPPPAPAPRPVPARGVPRVAAPPVPTVAGPRPAADASYWAAMAGSWWPPSPRRRRSCSARPGRARARPC